MFSLKKLLPILIIFTASRAFAACTVENSGFASGGVTKTYTCDLESEFPTSGLVVKDKAVALDTGRIAFATDATTWGNSLPTSETAMEAIIDIQDLQGAATDAQVPNNITITNLSGTNTGDQTSVSGNAGTATALAADPADCATSTHFSVGVNASGTATCEAIADADVPNDITITETDPQVGTLTNTKWCATDGTDIDCTQEPPAGTGDVTDVFSCASGDCASITVAATDLLNMSGTDSSTATEGLILPQHATACAGGTAEGQICWEADADKLWMGNGTVVKEVSYMPRGHIWGLTMSNAADTANDITIAAGEARDEGHTEDIVLTGAITKQLDASWAVGTNAGGINTGAEANSTWYEVHLIKRVDTGVVDVMFTTTANRATLPANYTKQRRIGWIRNDGAGAILQFTQIDDHITLTTQINDSSTACSATAAAVTLTVPPNSIARFRAGIDSTTSANANTGMVFSEIVEGNVTPALTTGILTLGQWDLATGSSGGHFELRASATSTIEFDCAVATGTFDISTFGWIDLRTRLSNT